MADDRSAPAGRHIPDPAFAGDDGGPDPALTAALAAYDGQPGPHLDVFVALQHARLLVPVVAMLGEAEHDAAEMATALLTGEDGRQALLVFTGLETLGRWRGDARPVPVAATSAARSALQEGAAALVVDVAGPTSYVLEGHLLEGLARGWPLLVTDDGVVAWVEPAAEAEASE